MEEINNMYLSDAYEFLYKEASRSYLGISAYHQSWIREHLQALDNVRDHFPDDSKKVDKYMENSVNPLLEQIKVKRQEILDNAYNRATVGKSGTVENNNR